MCPDPGSNPQSFGVCDDAPTNQAIPPGWDNNFYMVVYA